jgi:hypothetical protein
MPQDEGQSGPALPQTRGIIELVEKIETIGPQHRGIIELEAMTEKIETIGPQHRGIIELVVMKDKIETIRQAIPDVDPRDLSRWRAALDRHIAVLQTLRDEIHAAMNPADEG